MFRYVLRPSATPSQRLTRLAGLVLIALGILCLCLSGAVVQGWWQGTLDAFGVGFVVGGVVDVLAISILNQVIRAEDEQYRKNNRQAESILRGQRDGVQTRKAIKLLTGSGSQIDPELGKQLQALVNGRNNRQAESILRGQQDAGAQAQQAIELLTWSGGYIDPELGKQLLALVNAQWPRGRWPPIRPSEHYIRTADDVARQTPEGH